MLRVGIIQHTCVPNRVENIAKSIASIRACAKDGANLVVLQELHTDIYFCQVEDVSKFELASKIPGEVTAIFSAIAKECNVVLVTSLFEKRAAGLYHNTAVVFEKDGTLIGKYRKMHIPDDPAYYEKFYFTPGDMGFEPLDTSIGKLGVLVCWDQWYPEAARLMALAGAEVLIYPTAIGWESTDSAEEKARQFDAWQISQRAHAIANGVAVISVNRTGYEPDWSGATGGIEFWGQSFVAGPQGELLYQAPADQEVHQVIDINQQRVEEVRKIWPFFRDRRIDAYGDLLKRYID